METHELKIGRASQIGNGIIKKKKDWCKEGDNLTNQTLSFNIHYSILISSKLVQPFQQT